MEEGSGPSTQTERTPLSVALTAEEMDEDCEPQKKKSRTEDLLSDFGNKLEHRLSGILCCTVCLDLPKTCFQCVNGHLMCAGCFNHLLADARLKDETATCPNCRCEITKSSCCRNLAVEKAVSELPTACQFCQKQLPRTVLEWHERELCQERPSTCKFFRIGCPWRGPFHELQEHEDECIYPRKPGRDVMEALYLMDEKQLAEIRRYENLFSLLSFEKVTFNDLQLRPYRSDDFITKLFYETSRFSAFSQQWVVKARVNSDSKNPSQSTRRSLHFQLVLKSRLTSPLKVYFVVLKGPFGDIRVNPAIFDFEFNNDKLETDYQELPIDDSLECNKLLASKAINLRLILFQVSQ